MPRSPNDNEDTPTVYPAPVCVNAMRDARGSDHAAQRDSAQAGADSPLVVGLESGSGKGSRVERSMLRCCRGPAGAGASPVACGRTGFRADGGHDDEPAIRRSEDLRTGASARRHARGSSQAPGHPRAHARVRRLAHRRSRARSLPRGDQGAVAHYNDRPCEPPAGLLTRRMSLQSDILAESRTVLQASHPCVTTAYTPTGGGHPCFERPNRIPEADGHDFRAALADHASIRRELPSEGW